MSFIGILTEPENEMYLKKELKDKIDDIYFFSEDIIDNLRNIKFETIMLGKQVEQRVDVIRAMAQKATYLIINSDIKENLEIFDNLDLTTITYGYNQKSTITISSVEENKMMVCLQRTIRNVYGRNIEPQEIEVKISKGVSDYAVMEFISLILLYQGEN